MAYTPPRFSQPADCDAPFDLLAQDEGIESNAHDPEAGQTPRLYPRPAQNRAPFGKWKSKMVPGFPAADTLLPPGITAKDICKSFPNHVTDHIILALMREGKGAKAIDALIPAPPGKKKAGQSHSKIQLRISTIREAFPTENFPITSAKRARRSSPLSKDEGMSSDDDGTRRVTPDALKSSSVSVTAGSDTRRRRVESSQPQDTCDFIKDGRGNEDVRSGVLDPVTPNSSQWNLAPKGEPPLRSGYAGSLASSPSTTTTERRQRSSIEMQIKREYHRHQQLVFDVYYKTQPLSPLEMEQTVQAHCAETYDTFSRELQVKSGLSLVKAVLPNGCSEHSLSYLRRSITQSFARRPDFRTHVDYNLPQEDIDRRTEMAVLQDLLGRLYGWTKYLETKLEIERQTRSHKDLHAIVTGHGKFEQGEHEGIFRSSHSRAGHTPHGHHVNGPFYEASRPPFMTETSGKPKSTDLHHEGTRHAPGESITSVSEDMNVEALFPGPYGLRNTTLRDSLAAANQTPVLESGMSNALSRNLFLDQRFSAQGYQPRGRVDACGRIGRLATQSGAADHMMMDGTEIGQANPNLDFEVYMQEAGQFLTHEARAADLPPAPGKH